MGVIQLVVAVIQLVVGVACRYGCDPSGSGCDQLVVGVGVALAS